MAQIYEQYKFANTHGDSDYTKMLAGLLPRGVIWGINRLQNAIVWVDTIWSGETKRDTVSSSTEIQDSSEGSWSGGNLGLLLSVFASEFSRIEEDAWEVLNGTDPGVATGDYLADWERNLALPDETDPASPTLEERQISAHSRLFGEFVTTTEQAYIDYAASIGFTITIEQEVGEYLPRFIGQARMGYERIGGSGGFSVMRITVTAGSGTMEFFEGKMNKFKPAHAYIIYVDARP